MKIDSRLSKVPIEFARLWMQSKHYREWGYIDGDVTWFFYHAWKQHPEEVEKELRKH